MTTKETPTDVQPNDKKWTKQIATGAERETQKTRNTYEKVTCWRMLKSNFVHFLLHPSGFVFCFSSLFPFQCPLFSLSCYFFFGCFLLFFREEKRKDQSIPKYTKVPNPSKYTNIIQQTTPEIPEQNNNSSTLPFPVLRPGLGILGILGILGLLIFLGLRQCGLPDASWWHDCCVDFCKFLIF